LFRRDRSAGAAPAVRAVMVVGALDHGIPREKGTRGTIDVAISLIGI
jgi:hypothetical protein